ncbi:MAG: alpha/beta hydrolase [Cyanobacteria bacterium P01_C01_bin.120]
MTTVYFATNRNLTSPSNPLRFGQNFSTVDLGDLRFGQAQVNGGELDENSVQVLPDNPSQGSRALFAELRQTMRSQSLDALILIHGFNVTFETALESAAKVSDRLAQLSDNSYRPNVFVFSWPSNGRLFEYKDDRHDAKASGYAFARGLEKLTRFLRHADDGEPCQQHVHLLAHSMGNYVLRHALQETQKISNSRALPRLFDNIILAAADEDNDAFEHEHKFSRLPELAKRVTVYFNTEDQALTISDITKGNPDRLGHSGPRLPHQLPYKVVLVDVSEGVSTFGEHSYHVDDDEVVRDIIAVLQSQSLDAFTLRTYVAHANKFVLRH